MRILVVGAAGRTGSNIVRIALGHGHDVTAFVHSTPLQMTHERLSTVEGDVLDFDAVNNAVAGKSAVAFAISQGAGGDRTILEAGISNVIHAMAVNEVRRLAAVSAAGTFARTDKRLSVKYRALIATTLRSVYEDLEEMELRIMASDLDWAIIRPVGLTDDPPKGTYRVSLDGLLLPKTSRISRADVAAVVVKALETDTYHRRAVVVAD